MNFHQLSKKYTLDKENMDCFSMLWKTRQSWNSVRWNKPSTTGYRSQSSSIAAQFESKSYRSTSPTAATSRHKNATSEAARTAAKLASLGPSVSARASYFDSSKHDNITNKYRNEARELLNKWTNHERNGSSNADPLTSCVKKAGVYLLNLIKKRLINGLNRFLWNTLRIQCNDSRYNIM
ncbi:hypothetical protein DICVIV_02667 [Dictyocaulus viviparus]|uniref:Uncharacterized protein n=1 Tax=Dictyocaulus viviparus TaxID=29172 RepID=A0A0D8Y5F3_DICVI|nr:hypothetical protein DICVIV_02667 [Dictyocaulus viviparus]